MYGSIVVIKHNGDDGAAFVLDMDKVTIGRSVDTQIRIQRTKVSAIHAGIYVDDKCTVSLHNLSKKNPIFISEGRLPPGEAVELEDGDVFSIGGRQFRYEAPDVKLRSKPRQSIENKENANGYEQSFSASEEATVQDRSEVIKCEVDHSTRRRRISIEPVVSHPSPVARKRNNSIPPAFTDDQLQAAPARRRSAFQPVAELPLPEIEEAEEAASSSAEEEFLVDDESEAAMPTSVYAWKVANNATEKPEPLEVATPQRAIENLRSITSTQSILKMREEAEAEPIEEEVGSVFRTPSRAPRASRAATTGGRQRKARVSFAKTDHVLLTPVSSKSRLKKSLLYKTPTKLTSPQERSDMLYQLNRKLTSDFDEEDFLAQSGESIEEEDSHVMDSSDEEDADVSEAMLSSIRHSLPHEALVESPAGLACGEELNDSTSSAVSEEEETDAEFLLSRPQSARRGRRSLPATGARNSNGRGRRKSASATPGETPDMEQLKAAQSPARSPAAAESPSAAGISRTQVAIQALASPIQRIASTANIASQFVDVISSIVTRSPKATASVAPEPLSVRTLTSPITPQPRATRYSVSADMRFYTPSKQKDATPRTPEEKRAAQKALYALWHHLRKTQVDGKDACEPFKEHKNIFASDNAPSSTIIEIYSAIQEYRVATVAQFKEELAGVMAKNADSHTPGTAAHAGRLALSKAFNAFVLDLAEQGSSLVDEEGATAVLFAVDDETEKASADTTVEEMDQEADELDQQVDDEAAEEEADVQMADAEEEEELAQEPAQEEIAEEEPTEEAPATRRSARKSVVFDEAVEEKVPFAEPARRTRRSRASVAEPEEEVPAKPTRKTRRSRAAAEESQEEEAPAKPTRRTRRSRAAAEEVQGEAPAEPQEAPQEEPQEAVGSKRRSRRSAAPAPTPKKTRSSRRSRAAAPEPEPEAMEVEEAAAEAVAEVEPAVDYNSWTCVLLKKELKKRGLAVAGRKAALVARLEESDQAQASAADEAEEETVEAAPEVEAEEETVAAEEPEADEEPEVEEPPAKKTRGTRGKAKAVAKAPARSTRSRCGAKAAPEPEEEEEEEARAVPAKRTRRGAAKAAPKRSTRAKKAASPAPAPTTRRSTRRR